MRAISVTARHLSRAAAGKARCASTVTGVFAREILDSRGNPTVEVDLTTQDGLFRAAVPSGASTGAYEAVELRDGDKKRYLGKGVLKACQNVNNILAPALKGKDVTRQVEIDNSMIALDGTHNKANLGANAILAVSLAVAKAGAAATRRPLFRHFAALAGRDGDGAMILPVPMANVINGGVHSGNPLGPQEFMLAPLNFPTYAEALRAVAETYHTLKGLLKAKYGLSATSIGDEGGFAPPIATSEEALEILSEAIKQAGFEGRMRIAMDVAASECLDGDTGKYNLHFKQDDKTGSQYELTSKQLCALYEKWCGSYDIASIEDPFDQDDVAGWQEIQAKLGNKVQIVGDDLLCTNPKRIKDAIGQKSCGALLLKVNQIGSVSESIEAAKVSFKAGWNVMVSHRSGETEDATIAALAVGLSCGQIKTGAPARGERTAKLNELLRIEEQLGSENGKRGGGYGGHALFHH